MHVGFQLIIVLSHIYSRTGLSASGVDPALGPLPAQLCIHLQPEAMDFPNLASRLLACSFNMGAVLLLFSLTRLPLGTCCAFSSPFCLSDGWAW